MQTERQRRKTPASSIADTDAGHLAKLLGLAEEPAESWTPKDLADMLAHQLSAPLELDLAPQILSQVERVPMALAASQGIRTFGQLLACVKPPLGLLVIAKDFFKTQSGRGPNRRPEQEVAYLMYLACILAAKLRLDESISKLAADDLARGARWAVARQWLDARTRKFFLDAQRRLSGASG